MMISNMFGRILEKFVEPISSRPKLIFVITIIILVPTIGAEVVLTKLVQRNGTDSLMLVWEATNESGLNFVKARTDHADMLEHYLGRMERRPLSRFLGVLYPELSPDVQLKPILENLRDEEGAAREEIQAAAGAIREFFRNSEAFSGIKIVRFKPEVLTQELLKDVNDANEALGRSHELIDIYVRDLNVDNAEVVCRANRKAIGRVYLIRYERKNLVSREKLEQFRSDIERTIACNDALALQPTVTIDERKALGDYSESERFRTKILKAILDNNMEEARIFFVTAIEEAYKKEKLQ